jgi:uncharacterized OB-fold protein
MSAQAKPIPRVTPDLAPFFAAAKQHKLVVQRCTACGLLRFPPRELCSRCWSREAEWVPVSGRATVYSFYLMHQVYHPGFAAEAPYPVAWIELEEGPRLTSNVVDCPREEIRVGMPVEVVFEDLSEQVALPKFRPRRG